MRHQVILLLMGNILVILIAGGRINEYLKQSKEINEKHERDWGVVPHFSCKDVIHQRISDNFSKS